MSWSSTMSRDTVACVARHHIGREGDTAPGGPKSPAQAGPQARRAGPGRNGQEHRHRKRGGQDAEGEGPWRLSERIIGCHLPAHPGVWITTYGLTVNVSSFVTSVLFWWIACKDRQQVFEGRSGQSMRRSRNVIRLASR